MQEQIKAIKEATEMLDVAVGDHMLPILMDHEQLTIYMDEHKGNYNTAQIQAFQQSLRQVLMFVDALEEQLRFTLLLHYDEYIAMAKYGVHILKDASKTQGLAIDNKLCERATKLVEKFPLSVHNEEFTQADKSCDYALSRTIVRRYKAIIDSDVK